MDDCPRHPDGHACAQQGKHSLHRVQVGFQWITWGEPEPVERFRPPKKKSKDERDRERTAHLIDTVHKVTNTDPATMTHRDDPVTSKASAASIAPRTGTQKYHMLVVFSTREGGLTDQEAAEHWARVVDNNDPYNGIRRCSELRKDGFIEPTGETRVSPVSGEERMVSAITPAGLQALGVGSPA